MDVERKKLLERMRAEMQAAKTRIQLQVSKNEANANEPPPTSALAMIRKIEQMNQSSSDLKDSANRRFSTPPPTTTSPPNSIKGASVAVTNNATSPTGTTRSSFYGRSGTISGSATSPATISSTLTFNKNGNNTPPTAAAAKATPTTTAASTTATTAANSATSPNNTSTSMPPPTSTSLKTASTALPTARTTATTAQSTATPSSSSTTTAPPTINVTSLPTATTTTTAKTSTSTTNTVSPRTTSPRTSLTTPITPSGSAVQTVPSSPATNPARHADSPSASKFLAATAELKAIRENKGRISTATLLGKEGVGEGGGIKRLSDLQAAIELKKKQMEEERAKFVPLGTLHPDNSTGNRELLRISSVHGEKVAHLNSKLENFMDKLKAFEDKMELEQSKSGESDDSDVEIEEKPAEPVDEIKTEDIISTNLQISQKKKERRMKRNTMLITAELRTGDENLLAINALKETATPRDTSKDSLKDDEKSKEYRDGMTKTEWMRSKVIEELINTEEDYINDLILTSKVFYMPIREKKLLKEKEIETIFSTMTMLLGVNSELLKVFKQELDAGTGNIGHAFCWMLDFLKMYSGYCNNQDLALRTLERCTKTNSRLDHFLKEQLKNPECRQLPLNSYLIKPVQRITKYPLLLRELVKNTDPSHPDYKHLEKAAEHLQVILSGINENARKVENHSKVQEIRERLDRGKKIIDPAKHIYSMEAIFREASYDVVRKTFEVDVGYTVYILFNNLLIRATEKSNKVITLTNGKKLAALKLVEAIPLEYLSGLRNVADDATNQNIKNAFEITYKIKTTFGSPQSNIIVLTPSPDIKKAWITALATTSISRLCN